jgi:hypothetical protein
MSKFHLTLKSGNSKTGPIPVSISSSDTCPDSCSYKAVGCYAKGGPMAMAWRRVDKQGGPFAALVEAVAGLKAGQLSRLNAAGDLPGLNNDIDRPALQALTLAAKGKRLFTYTHKPITLRAARRGNASIETVRANRAAVSEANLHGLTINVSCDSLVELDELGDALPAVVVLPQPEPIPDPADAALPAKERRERATARGIAAAPKVVQTPEGRRVVICPAQYKDDTTCDTCRLCSRVTRACAVGFWAHGYAHSQVSRIAGKVHLGVITA